MRKITQRILAAVMLVSFVCIIIIFLLNRNISFITEKYEDMINHHVTNYENMSLIAKDMYHIESLVWMHITANDAPDYDKYENEIGNLQREMDKSINTLNDNITDSSEKEIMHLVAQSYRGFSNCMETVLSLSRSNSKDAAGYYIVNSMSQFFDNVTVNMENMAVYADKKYSENIDEMNTHIQNIKFWKIGSIAAASMIIVLCVITVMRINKGIITTQEEEVRSHQKRIMDMQHSIIIGMANLIESRDGETGEHVKRTEKFANMIADKLMRDSVYSDMIDEKYIMNLSQSAPLHDVGKIKIPDAILRKPGKLTDEEFEIIKTHTTEGGRIIYNTMGGIGENDYINMAHDVAMYHHEKWNGKGYPSGISGEDIPLCARIMAVADVFDALVSKRCYKKEMSVEQAYSIIQNDSGSHFDPIVVNAFTALRSDIEQYLKENEEV